MWRATLLLLLPALSQAQPALKPVPLDLPCRYGVIGLRPSQAAPDTLEVLGLVPGGPASRAGLQTGDRILASPPYALRRAEDLARLVQSRAPGDTLNLLVDRRGEIFSSSCAVADRLALFSFMGAPPRPLPFTPNPVEQGVGALLSRQPGALERLTFALAAEDLAYGADCRLNLPRRALLHPLSARQVLAELETAGAETDLMHLLARAAAHLDLGLHSLAPTPLKGDSLLGALAPVFLANQWVETALSPLSPEELQALCAGAPALLRTLADHPSPDLGDILLDAQLRRMLGLAKRVDLAPLFRAAAGLASLSTPSALTALRRLSRSPTSVPTRPPGIEGELLFAHLTPQGWILVGGEGPNHYRGEATVLIDLGGDDIYELDPLPPVFLSIDYRGKDQYRGAVAAPIAGVALVLDLEGDDRYEAGWLGQGAAFCGVGVLLDRAGSDQYQAAEYAQGAALFGAGLLLDQEGNDTYSAARHGQGLGGPRGFGLLRDAQGDDQYRVDGKVPSAYGDEGLFEGWAQGVGCGVRGYAEGGIGLLLDQRGNDQYQGGNFAQGTGYFFGLGALVDRGGDDRYLGGRYAQGTAAHQAVGLLCDREGSDRYESRPALGQGSAWDAALGALFDLSGDDRYRGGELSQGAGAMNGLGLLYDRRGRDTYQALSGQGAGGSLEYWGGRDAPNLGLLLDGGGRDSYNLPGRGDRTGFSEPGLGFFEDQ